MPPKRQPTERDAAYKEIMCNSVHYSGEIDTGLRVYCRILSYDNGWRKPLG